MLSMFHSYSPRTHLRIRRALRRLCREADARLALVRAEGFIVEHDGDEQAMPLRYPVLSTSVGSLHRLRCRDGESVVASSRVRIMAGWPPLDVFVVEPGVENTEVFVALDDAVEAIEDAVFANGARTRPAS